MNHLIRTLATLFVLIALNVSTQNAAAQDSVEHPDVTLGVEGLACPICAYGLEKRLKKIDSIDIMSFHIEDGEVRIVLKEGSKVSENELREAVTDAGFTLTAVEYRNEKSKSGADGK